MTEEQERRLRSGTLEPPATAEELAWAKGPGSICGCTGRCKKPPHFTCSGKPRDEETMNHVSLLRRHPELLRWNI